MRSGKVSCSSTSVQDMGRAVTGQHSSPQLSLPGMVSFSPWVFFKIGRFQQNSSCLKAEVVSKNGIAFQIGSMCRAIFIRELQSICNAKLKQNYVTYKIVQNQIENSTRQFGIQTQNGGAYVFRCQVDEGGRVRFGFGRIEAMVEESQSSDVHLLQIFLSLLKEIDSALKLLLQRVGVMRASFHQKLKISREIQSSKRSFQKIIKSQISPQVKTQISEQLSEPQKTSSGVFEQLNVVRQQRLNQNEMVFKRGGYFDIVKRKLVVYSPKDQSPVFQCKKLAQKKLSKRKRPNTIYNYEGKIPKELKLLECLSSLSLYELTFFAKYYVLNLQTRTDVPSQEMIDEQQCNGKDTVSTMSEESPATMSDVIYMDFYEENLEEYLIRKGKLDLFEMLHLIRQVFESVRSLHKVGIVHRDIKPANFMIERLQDGRIRTKLIDFGESAHVASNYDSSQILGFSTPYAPIQCTYQCKEGFNAKEIDLWSVGVLIYKLATDRMPVTYSKCFKSDIKYEWPTSLTFFIPQYQKSRWGVLQNMLVGLSMMFMRVRPEERLSLEKGLLILDEIERLATFYACQQK